MVIERLQELESEGNVPAAKELARGVLQNDSIEHIEICEADNCVVVTTTHFEGVHDIDLANGVWRTTGMYRVRDDSVDVEIETSMHADAVEPYVRPQVLFVCTAPPAERSEMVEQVLDVRGVVDVRETLTGSRNLFVEAVGTGTADTVRITEAVHDIGLSIESSEILRQRRVQPFNHFFFTDPYDNEEDDDRDE